MLSICAFILSAFTCYTLYMISKYIQAKTDEVRVQIAVYEVPKVSNAESQRILEQIQDEPAEVAIKVIRDPSMASYVGSQQEEELYDGWN
jgi:hypothetical protein